MRIHHVAMRTHDLPSLERFYAGLLELRVIQRDDSRGSVWLDAGGTVLMLERALPGEPGPAHGSLDLLAFALDDADEDVARERWRARVSIEAETPHTLYFRDPDGRRIALSSYRFV